MNLHPMVTVSLSLHQHPGRYALLLGSGISSAANIQTGWGITLDLIRKLAAAEGESEACRPDPAQWYSDKTEGKDPDYSEIIEELASKEDERQSLLRRYFEPADDEEREEGSRVPTKAHHAIAKLAKSKYIRVIVTLNFDRLLEEAMSAAGIHPNVVSSEDGVVGMVPLNHGEVTIIKLHGDYRDTQLRNTSSELASYPKHLQELLDELSIFNSRSFQQPLKRLGRSPAVLTLYACGISAIAKGRYDLLRVILWETQYSEDGHEHEDRVAYKLSVLQAFAEPHSHALLRESEADWANKQRYHTPGSNFIFKSLWPMLQPVLMNRSHYENCFNQLEVAISLCCVAIPDRAPTGRFCWRSSALEKLMGSRESPGPLALNMEKFDFFGGERSRIFDAHDNLIKQLQSHHW